ncbi:uncharacterized protein [Drosophila bipectinata]|uniref:uncharacterized protein n=1 Tax=Drosophila bipectinata TaxID=42026 RepID=UPI0038B2E7F3
MVEQCFRKLGLGVILSALVLYFFIYGSHDTVTEIRDPFFVNTEGCRIISMDVMNHQIEKFTNWEWNHPKFKLKCPKTTWFRTEMANGDWYLKLSRDIDDILKESGLTNDWEITCYWLNFKIHRRWRSKLTHRTRFDLDFPYVLKVPKGVRHLRLQCVETETNKSVYNDAYFFIQPPPEELLRKPLPRLHFWGRKDEKESNRPPISVMILGMDSVSHLNFIRQMPKTAAYMRSNMSHVEFWGMNKIGVNTYPNLISLLTGLSADEANGLISEDKYMDNLPLIWKDFKKAGYNTSFGEDNARFSMFYFGQKGFDNHTTDHNLHDFMAELHLIGQSSSFPLTYCIGDRTFLDVLMEMTDRMLPHYQRYPFFSFYWWSNGLHEFFNSPRLMDERFQRLLGSLDDSGVTNNTLIFFMSDHGMRWGKFRHTFQGMIEDSQPLLSVLYPKWMRETYPQAIQNLHSNAHSLMTTYDLYATMKHVLDIESLQDESIQKMSKDLWDLKGNRTPRAVSLFLPIPPWRNCISSHIKKKFCLCHRQVSIPPTDRISKQSAQLIVDSINKMLEEYAMCIPLQLDFILSVHFEVPERDFKKNNHIEARLFNENYMDRGPSVRPTEYSDLDIIVRLKTKPMEAFFEGMTRKHGTTISRIGKIIRVGDNKNKTNGCIANAKLEPFCHCGV